MKDAYVCEECGKHFDEEDHLEKHLKRHGRQVAHPNHEKFWKFPEGSRAPQQLADIQSARGDRKKNNN